MDLMGELQEEMEYGKDDLSERLGRPKPEMASIEIEAKPKMEGDMDDPEMDMADDMPMEEEGPDAILKKRLMNLRG